MQNFLTCWSDFTKEKFLGSQLRPIYVEFVEFTVEAFKLTVYIGLYIATLFTRQVAVKSGKCQWPDEQLRLMKAYHSIISTHPLDSGNGKHIKRQLKDITHEPLAGETACLNY